ncbi:MAG: hypothetical protein ACC661_09290, partial [Verrucomicrobiales bacterium]
MKTPNLLLFVLCVWLSRSRKLLCSFVAICALCETSHAQVEVVAGLPATAAINEPFSVAFDGKNAMHGVEFTKSNR